MFVLFPGLPRVDVSLDLLGLEGGIIINGSPGPNAKSLMMGYSHYFLWKSVHSKQTKNYLSKV